jgi:hypothetical protein
MLFVRWLNLWPEGAIAALPFNIGETLEDGRRSRGALPDASVGFESLPFHQDSLVFSTRGSCDKLARLSAARSRKLLATDGYRPKVRQRCPLRSYQNWKYRKRAGSPGLASGLVAYPNYDRVDIRSLKLLAELIELI